LKVFIVGAIYGLMMRLVFALFELDNIKDAGSGPMLASFVLLVPFLIGVYTAHSDKAALPSLGFAIFGPWVPTLCLIGGKYFDLVDNSYKLVPEAGGTRLDIVVNYRVSTNFNWYSAWWGRVLVDDSAAAILRFYKNRSEG
jgi:hypothetical protein